MVTGSISVRFEETKCTANISMSNLPDDVSLIKRIAAQDDAAMRELHALYGQRMMAYALNLTQNGAMAEDVVQDSLIAVWRSAGRFRREGRVIAWLLGIVHHTAMKALRHPHQPISEGMAEMLVAADPSPEEQVEVDERAAWVRRGLQSLSPNHRAALELVFYQGMSLADAADVCGCPLGTIKSRLSYARRYLRDVLSSIPQVEDGR
jgi:RNA polymerase sigma factor (sigma-70 family)